MKISQKAEYAIRAMLDLAIHAPASRGVRSLEVAHRTGVPEKFLEVILLDLRKAGLVSSKRGPDGGHWLARDPSRVTVGAILEAIDGPLWTTGRTEPRSDAAAAACLRELWTRVERVVHGVVEGVTLEDLRRQIQGAVDFCI